ncbi:MAG TPA: tRNA (adenosine(37)-N6)-threonylcarbamoyltransferase complex ATPase subunit type 1 TsaE [Candidatus Omnitrophota bacterium]|nr:tRNA (adenosine(37)-N6)-threonylcarbamoyltransferase complex ATPase subunit type 1 TsaE [Candidatus Omnitrophota bacterium]
MASLTLTTRAAEETMAFGQKLGRRLVPGNIVCMFGDLGSGKTTFVRGVAKGLGVNPDEIHSPTFVLLNVYRGRLALYHYDFYRLESPDEIAAIGYDDFLYGKGVSFIEWSERFGPLIPKNFLRVEFVFIDETRRRITLSAKEKGYARLVEDLRGRVYES